jgi:hypothetical protein
MVPVKDSPDDAEFLIAKLRPAGFAPSWKRVDVHDVPNLVRLALKTGLVAQEN